MRQLEFKSNEVEEVLSKVVSDLSPRIEDGSLTVDLLGLYERENPFEDEYLDEEHKLLQAILSIFHWLNYEKESQIKSVRDYTTAEMEELSTEINYLNE